MIPVEVALYGFLDLLLARIDLYRHTWHPGLFRVALFLVLFCGASLIVHRT
jgi:protein AaeX